MLRIPSIHTIESELVKVLEEIGEAYQDDPDVWYNVKFVARQILERVKSKSISHRSIIASNEKLLRNTERLKLNSRTDTGLFAEILVLLRRKYKHRAIEIIKPGHVEWLMLKEISKLATDFCNEFNISKKEGYKIYIEIALGKMQKFSLNKFKPMNASIYLTYEAKLEIQSDKTPDQTDKAYKIYLSIINNRIGHFYEDYKKNVEKYACFKKAKDEAAKMKLPINQYITAQFEDMEWRDGIPDPMQLYGEKAIERARKYCYKHSITLSSKNIINFNSIKKANAKNKNNSKQPQM